MQRSTFSFRRSSIQFYPAFFHELRRFRYIEGRNLILERYPAEQPTAQLARDMFLSKPGVIFSIGPWTRFLLRKVLLPRRLVPKIGRAGAQVAWIGKLATS